MSAVKHSIRLWPGVVSCVHAMARSQGAPAAAELQNQIKYSRLPLRACFFVQDLPGSEPLYMAELYAFSA